MARRIFFERRKDDGHRQERIAALIENAKAVAQATLRHGSIQDRPAFIATDGMRFVELFSNDGVLFPPGCAKIYALLGFDPVQTGAAFTDTVWSFTTHRPRVGLVDCYFNMPTLMYPPVPLWLGERNVTGAERHADKVTFTTMGARDYFTAELGFLYVSRYYS